MTKRLIPLCLLLSISPLFAAEPWLPERVHNWHQWRGPFADGVAPEGDPPLKWDAKTNVRWKTALPGKGSSSPVVWGDRIFVQTAVDTGRPAALEDLPKPNPRFNDRKTAPPKTYYQFVVLALQRDSGKVLWQKVAREAVPHEGIHQTHSYAAFSPTTDGQRVYCDFGSRGVFCYDLDGKLLWQRDLGLIYPRYGWGEGGSPVIHRDSLIVNRDHEGDSFLIVLDAATGKTRWKADRKEISTWTTPLVVEHKGRTQVIVAATNRVRAYDLKDGQVIWECGGHTINVIPSPVSKDGVVYVLSGYKGAVIQAIPLDSTGDITDRKKLLWSYDRGAPYVPSPLLLGDRLYFTQLNNSVLTCLDSATGKPVIDRQRLPGLGDLYASPVAAKDRIYFTDRDGTTLVLRKGDKLEVLARNQLDDPIDASPAIVGKQLFLRSHGALYCIQEK
jgi:outer membrane protein assembly factor BamB